MIYTAVRIVYDAVVKLDFKLRRDEYPVFKQRADFSDVYNSH